MTLYHFLDFYLAAHLQLASAAVVAVAFLVMQQLLTRVTTVHC